MKQTKKLILASLFAALTCVATMIIHFQTPTMGYIHLGDAMVLLCGALLGPLYGSLAAGIGSMLADLFSGYVTYAPATFIIKALTACIAAGLSKELLIFWKQKRLSISMIIAGCVGEAFMVVGYFFFEIFLLGATSNNLFTKAGFAAGIASAASGVPFNVVQGIFGVIISAILFPILRPIFLRSQNEQS